MVKAVVRTIVISENSISFTVESAVDPPVAFPIGLSRNEFAIFKAENPDGTFEDYVKVKVKQVYDGYVYMQTLAKKLEKAEFEV